MASGAIRAIRQRANAMNLIVFLLRDFQELYESTSGVAEPASATKIRGSSFLEFLEGEKKAAPRCGSKPSRGVYAVCRRRIAAKPTARAATQRRAAVPGSGVCFWGSLHSAER